MTNFDVSVKQLGSREENIFIICIQMCIGMVATYIN